MNKEHEQKTIKFYAHDYAGMAMKESDLKDMLEGFIEAYECEHECSSDCRKVGCNCDCGKYHF